jgi:hypothetical protein
LILKRSDEKIPAFHRCFPQHPICEWEAHLIMMDDELLIDYLKVGHGLGTLYDWIGFEKRSNL